MTKKYHIAIFLTILFTGSNSVIGQTNEQQITKVISLFQKSIESKNLEGFMDLFVEESNVSWVGNGAFGIQFGSPSSFINMLKMTNKEYREDFHNISIWNDNRIGVVTFDYGFFGADNLANWGKESWMLIKVNDNWKITSVNYSMILPNEQEYPFD